MLPEYITGTLKTPAGNVWQVATRWSRADVRNTIKVRWNMGRMNYLVKPGLYAVGDPDENSNIFVSANFKLSFDHLRRVLEGMNAWVLVLDTKGINVWCAAGKGTFGTRELTYRIKAHDLNKIVAHKKVIVPQLGAVGVSAHEVLEKTGFHVIYGPVKASDIPEFVKSGLKASPEMRRVRFPFYERLKLIPVEITFGGFYLVLVPAVFFILSGLSSSGYSVDDAWTRGGMAVLNLFAAYMAGCVLTPAFLPWIPFRRFSIKGLITGWGLAVALYFLTGLGNTITEIISWFLIMGGISSFLAMNFTGSSTYTSLSGVKKEMRLSLPLQIIAVSLGLIGWIISLFI